MRFKKLIIINLCLLLILLVGCKDNTTTSSETTSYNFFPIEYELEDVEGTIKCTNLKYVFCLEKKQGEDFTILNFADVQLTKEEAGTENALALGAKALMEELIEEVNPDLITLTGDQGYGEKLSINFIAKTINEYDIPFAPVFGNHDNDGATTMTLRDQIKEYNKYENCIMHYGPSQAAVSETVERGGNYIINIVERDNNGGFHIVRTLFMFNSGNQTTEVDYDKPRINNNRYDHLTKRQLEFYKWGLDCAKKYTLDGEYPKSTIVEHIPITAYAHALAEALEGGNYSAYNINVPVATSCSILPENSANPAYWKEGYKDSFGVAYEAINCSANDDGIFEYLLELGSTDSMIVGHDHNNCFSINYQGIRLTFGVKTGHGCYFNSFIQGGTKMIISDTGITFENIYK